MNYTLLKYKTLKLLIDDRDSTAQIINNLAEIEELASDCSEFYLNLMSATKKQGEDLESRKDALLSKIGYKIIGTPFSTHDAELYALERKLDYETFELHGNSGNSNATKEDPRTSHIHMRVTAKQKSKWVGKAQKEGLKLSPWIEKKLE